MQNNTKKRLYNKRGSLTVEAAIFLPLFIIGMLTLGYLVKFNAVQENVFHSFADETSKIAAEASYMPVAPYFKNDVTNRVDSENKNEIKNSKVTGYLYNVPLFKKNHIITASLDYDIDIGLPAKFIDSVPVSETIICRAFVGDSESINPMSFSEMEKNIDSEEVWVFPKSGERYHGEKCSFIKNDPKERMLTSEIRNVYNPCKTCKPSNIRDGNMVYCFTTGKVYHKGECSTVTKYVTAIDKKEAESRGYSACTRCGGN